MFLLNSWIHQNRSVAQTLHQSHIPQYTNLEQKCAHVCAYVCYKTAHCEIFLLSGISEIGLLDLTISEIVKKKQ